MNEFKAMAFIVEDNLDKILSRLGEKGYQLNFKLTDEPVCIVTNTQGGIGFLDFIVSGNFHKFTNIDEVVYG